MGHEVGDHVIQGLKLMNKEKLKEDIIDLYYGESDLSLKEISIRHQVSLKECQEELKNLIFVSKTYQQIPDLMPSQLSINKIMVHAKEKALELQKRSFWQVIFRPAYTFAMILVIGVVSYYVWMVSGVSNQNNTVAQNNVVINNQNNNHLIKERLFKTPLDSNRFSKTYSLNKRGKYFYPNISDVNLGSQPGSYSLDDELDKKMLVNNLTLQDIETLYFRARKLEKQGYYQEALHDYVFLAKNYPSFKYQKALPLAIVRCYEELGHKKTALSVLEDYEKIYGTNEDIRHWKDQLKSETF